MTSTKDIRARVVVQYDDPRGGIWRGPIESLEQAQRRLEIEQARVRGHAWLQQLSLSEGR